MEEFSWNDSPSDGARSMEGRNPRAILRAGGRPWAAVVFEIDSEYWYRGASVDNVPPPLNGPVATIEEAKAAAWVSYRMGV